MELFSDSDSDFDKIIEDQHNTTIPWIEKYRPKKGKFMVSKSPL